MCNLFKEDLPFYGIRMVLKQTTKLLTQKL